MTDAVSLSKFLYEMDSLGFLSHVYMNRKTGEFLSITEDEVSWADQEDDDEIPEEERELMPKIREALSSEDWIELPSKFDMDEAKLMREFCLTVEDTKLREELLAAVLNRGTFSRFKTLVHENDLDKQWYAFREKYLRQTAVEWLQANDIAYQD